MNPQRALLTAALLSTSACHDWFDGVLPYVCESRQHPGTTLPQRLSETGLYEAAGSERLASGVVPYAPEFELWADGATKRRWLWLPEGESIDTSDPDDWEFPVGTRAWKEFSRDGVRLETRLLERIGPGPGDWAAVAYVWEGTDAHATASGYVDAGGTKHDVPAASECAICHAGRRSFLLGVSAIQLAYDAPPGQADLEELAGVLSVPLPLLAIPGDATARTALGYLHANCAHCHNSSAPSDRPCFEPDNRLDFWLRSDRLDSVEATPTYASAVGDVIEPGRPRDSSLVAAISTRDLFERMPPLGTRRVDERAVATIRSFIEDLP